MSIEVIETIPFTPPSAELFELLRWMSQASEDITRFCATAGATAQSEDSVRLTAESSRPPQLLGWGER
jgi:hypothetical protein